MLRLWLLGLLAVSFIGLECSSSKIADEDYLLKQKKIYNLLFHVSQPITVSPSLYEEGQAWDIESKIDFYTNTDAVKAFLSMYGNGMLARGELFSTFYPKLLEEMKALFKLFYYAKDFDAFYNTALWARNHVNEAQFIFALYNAVIRRPDTQYIQLPLPYELYPYLFFNSEVLEKAHHAKIFGQMGSKKYGAYETYIIPANYSGWYLTREYNMENRLNYFVEDIDLATYYFFFQQNFPAWLEKEEFDFPSYRGEEYLYGHVQLLNRYYLERLSNGLPQVEDFDWQSEFYAGYYPSMTFHNGLPLPQRPAWSRFPAYKYKYIQDIEGMESRVTAAIDSGMVLSKSGKFVNIYTEPNGLSILGNIIQGNSESLNREFYGSIEFLARKILGFNIESTNKYQTYPSALETYSASLRDPAFYRLCKRMASYYYRYKLQQKPYKKDEIIYPSLKIESLAVDKLITYFDQVDASISNGMIVADKAEAESLLIKVRQYRLNHKPFSFHIAINADKPMRAAIRIFLGPKYDSHYKLMELPEKLKYFYEIDNWILDLNAGLNKISRKSQDLFFVIPDQEPSEVYYDKILGALAGNMSLNINERLYGFPERLILPKGRRDGMPFEIFLYVSPVASDYQYSSRVWGDYKFDNKPFGFPLDKPLYNFNYDGPNMIFKDILIYYKDESDVNIVY